MKFKFIAINVDFTLRKSIIIASSLSEAHNIWCSQYGEIPFIGNLNIYTVGDKNKHNSPN